MAFTFAAAVAWDPIGKQAVKNTSFQVYATADTGFVTPLAITDTFGVALPGNILNSGSQGIFPEFEQAAESTVVITDPAHTYVWTITAIMQDTSVAAFVNKVGSASDVAVKAAAKTAISGELDIPASDIATKLSATYATLDADGKQPVRKGELVVNAKDYGAVGDGVADDTAALNTAAAAALALSQDAELYLPLGTYKTTGTVTVKCGLNASQATLSYTGSGTALILGSTVVGSGGAIQRRVYKAPRVVKTGTGWDGTSIGILAANLVSCELYVPFVYQFEQGLVCQGFGTGFAHNNINIGALWGNHKNLTLTQDQDGWCNSNQFFGGRLAYGTAWSTVDDMDGTHLNMVAPAGATAAAPNANTFWGTSFESGNHMYYRATIAGRYNVFNNCRWEALGGSIPRIHSLATADKNIVNGGYDVWRIMDVVDAGGRPPALVNSGSVEYHAHAATAKTFTASGASNEQLVDTWTQVNGVQCSYAAGLFTPRAGIWRVKVTLGISCASGSGYRLLTLKKGATVLDLDRKAGYSGLMTLTVESTETFNGTETFAAYFDQTAPTGSDVTLSTTARYCRVQATYLGAA